MNQLMAAKEVANIFKVKPATVTLWARQGKIEGTKIGKSWKFTKEEVKRVIKEGI